jgi:pimeloyl-ACP methyl ester carboxylesterase
VSGPCPHQHRAGSAEPLLLIHGIGSSWRVWNPVLSALEARHDVLAISLPGFGESPPLEREPTGPALADAVEKELDAAGIDTAHLAGNSLGGWLCAELARRGRARSVVAISPAGLWTPRELEFVRRSLKATRASAVRLAAHAERLTRSRVIRTLLFLQVAARGWKADPEEAAYGIRALAGSPSFDATLEWMTRDRNLARGLDRIDCPFLVVWGTWDFLLPLRQAPRWARLVPGAELRELPRLGHVPMADDPAQVARTILDFTSRHSRPEAAPRAEAASRATAIRS